MTRHGEDRGEPRPGGSASPSAASPRATTSGGQPGSDSRVTESSLGVRQFIQAPTVAALFDQFTGGGEIGLRAVPRIRRRGVEQPGAMQVDVGQEQAHRTAFGDVPSFVEIDLGAIGTGARRNRGYN